VKRFHKNEWKILDEIVAVCSSRENAIKVRDQGPRYSVDDPQEFSIHIVEKRLDCDLWNVLGSPSDASSHIASEKSNH